MYIVSVPIRGLFNLTIDLVGTYRTAIRYVSVPIRGLFNLTLLKENLATMQAQNAFPSPSGDYLI